MSDTKGEPHLCLRLTPACPGEEGKKGPLESRERYLRQISAGLPKGECLGTCTFAWMSTKTFHSFTVCLTYLEEKNSLKPDFQNVFPYPPLATFFPPTVVEVAGKPQLTSKPNKRDLGEEGNQIWD